MARPFILPLVRVVQKGRLKERDCCCLSIKSSSGLKREKERKTIESKLVERKDIVGWIRTPSPLYFLLVYFSRRKWNMSVMGISHDKLIGATLS